MLDNFLNSMPKALLAFLAITIGFFVIYQMDPPRTVCDSQLELFQQQQKKFLYGDAPETPRALAQKCYEFCKTSNGPGGCFEFFQRLKKMNQDLAPVKPQCYETFASDDQLKKWIQKSMTLMTEISWGDRGPASVTRKNAWFDTSDLSTFCDLKKHATQIYGIEEMDQWREKVLASLPEASKLDHESVYDKSLMSTSCEAYR